ncbi:MAG: hypothetical protein EA378_10975 [Phycisphaerales bacterium]|nr:MAG: hypothetical protein EA378_10975 [Phycisphaerales bacterium]
MVHLLMIGAVAAIVLRESLSRPAFESFASSFGGATAWTLGPMAFFVLLAWARAWASGRRLDRVGDAREVIAAERWAGGARAACAAWFALGVLGFGWLDRVRALVGDPVLLDELLALLPLCLAMIATWWASHPIERRVREALLFRALEQGRALHRPPGRARAVWMTTRHQLLFVLVPMSLILSWAEGVAVAFNAAFRDPGGFWGRALPAWALDRAEWVAPLAQMLGVLVVMAFAPAILRFVWDTTPLGPGPLRDHLRAMCARHRVRISGLLVWRTGGTMINGAVLGLVWPARYVLLTDALLDALTRREVEAVMAHEIAHVRRRHMPWLAGTVLGTLVLVGSGLTLLGAALPGRFGSGEGAGFVIAVASFVVAGAVFGWVSRVFERQADAFAAQHMTSSADDRTPDETASIASETKTDAATDAGEAMHVTPEAAAAMAGALQRVAVLNHVAIHRFTFRHGSIADRQRRLWQAVGCPLDALPADRAARRAKRAGLAIMGAAAAFLLLEAWLSASPGAGV